MHHSGGDIPILGIMGWSGAGKTTLLEQLIPDLRQSGLKVSVIKHTHHTVDLDQPGKDSYRMRQAGATEIILAGQTRFALLHEIAQNSPNPLNLSEPPPLASLVPRLTKVDLVLVEGFRHENFPKIEIYRAALGKKLIAPEDSAVLAVATDLPNALQNRPDLADLAGRPILDLNNIPAISAFIRNWMARHNGI
ncbi:MAG: molybdopterin-guanine dinucleotide biosynthesis protein B [Alphaproteobacteria bacterium]|nr:molybdopterin-guanine dinucleotide biosynthesis protein B [Alphaproteobacteria bacterium]